MSGVNLNEQFITGSVVKAMLLVAYLRRLNAIGQHYIDPYSNSFLYPMINVSDNDAATVLVDRRKRRPVRGRRGGRDDPFLGRHHRFLGRLVGRRADHRRRPGQVLLRDGLPDPAGVRRLRQLPALHDRRL